MSVEPTDPPAHVAFQVFLDGIVAAVRSVFFYVLVGNYVGLGALAHEVGFTFWWMALSTVLIWAAPAQVILVSTLSTAALFGAAAMFITPISFLTSTARNARILLEKAALALGLAIGPVLAFSNVQFDLLWTGVIGGTLAYVLHRVQRTRSAKT